MVAAEVRKLAERASLATREIAGLVAAIQQRVGEASAAMDHGVEEVEAGAIRASEAGQGLADILQAAEAANRQVEHISSAAQQMHASSGELLQAMEAVSAVVETNTAATEEMASGSTAVTRSIGRIASVSGDLHQRGEAVGTAAEAMSAQVHEMMDSAQALNRMAHALQELVGQFNLSEHEARPVPAVPQLRASNGRNGQPQAAPAKLVNG